MTDVLRVQFLEDVSIPGLGEKGGLNHSRAGGSLSPIDHDMTWDESTGVVRIRHLTRDLPVVVVPLANVRFLELSPAFSARVDLDTTESVTEPVEPEGGRTVVIGPKPEPVVAAPEPIAGAAMKRGKRSSLVVGDDDGHDE